MRLPQNRNGTMKKLNSLKRIFVSLIIAMLIFPSLTFWIGDGGGGNSKLLIKEPKNFAVWVRNIKRPPLLEGYEMGIYQKDLTAWFNNYFYFRGFFIRLKNSLFYGANFKRFSLFSYIRLLSYKNRIVGTLSFSLYQGLLFTLNRHRTGGKGLTIEKLKYVQQELHKRNKKILFVLPHTSNAYGAGVEVDPYYQYFTNYYRADIIEKLEAYDELFTKEGINYFDTRAFFADHPELTKIGAVSRYDIHWNRYGAGIAVIETLKYLKTRYKTDWEIPQIKSVEISSTSDLYEVHALNSLNLFLSLENAFMQKKLEFPYIVYEVPKKENQTKIVVLGDSFTMRYVDQLKASKFTDEKNITKYENADDKFKSNTKQIIDDNDIIIIIYVQLTFYGRRFEQVLNGFYDYLKEQA
jgi:hypothetical protein